MQDDKKRRNSILKITDANKKVAIQKRKRVSFAPEEILHRFTSSHNKNSDASSRFHVDNQENEPSEADLKSLSKSPILGLSTGGLIQSQDPQIFSEQIFLLGNDNSPPKKGGSQIISTSSIVGKNRLPQSKKLIMDTSLIGANSPLRRSPRLRNKIDRRATDSLILYTHNEIKAPCFEESCSQSLDDPFNRNQRILDLDDITIFEKDEPKPIHKLADIAESHVSVDMEISTTFTAPATDPSSPIFKKEKEVSQSVNMDISNNLLLPGELNSGRPKDITKSVMMETSALNQSDFDYSMLLVQKTKEHQEKILNLSHELRSVLNMSISECMDIANQSSLSGSVKLVSRIHSPESENTLKMLRMRDELKSVDKFVTTKSDEVTGKNRSKQEQLRGFGETYLNNLDTAKSCLISKLLEYENIKNTFIGEYSEAIKHHASASDALSLLSANRLKPADFLRKLEIIHKKFNIFVVPISDLKFKIITQDAIVIYLIECGADLNIVSCTVSFNSHKDGLFYQLLYSILKDFSAQLKSPSNLFSLLSNILKINKISQNFKLLYCQLDSILVNCSCIKYDCEKIGFTCFIRGGAAFIVWTMPYVAPNLSITIQLVSVEKIQGDLKVEDIEEKIVGFLRERTFEVLDFFNFIQEMCKIIPQISYSDV